MKLTALLHVLLLAVSTTAKSVDSNKILLISMDGFRWDYLNNAHTPNFDKLISSGSTVKQVTNAFATLTMPNHWTMVTGLYEEDHGIISNKFFDPVYDRTYKFSTDTMWYNNSEPIWITAEKENVSTGAYMWVGNQAEYEGKTASKVVPFRGNDDRRRAFDKVLDWFTKDDVKLVALYMNEPDKTGHKYGPNSQEVRDKVEELDSHFGYLIDRLDKLNLSDQVNIIIVSDHGMTEVSNEKSINLGWYVDFKEDVKWSYVSAIGLITPKEGKLDKVYNALKSAEANETHFRVYKKENIPEELHYKNSRRIAPIVLVAENGWLMKKADYKVNLKGNHGFDNQHSDMKTLLIARGPKFKCGYKQESLRSVDVYPLMCHLLNLKHCHHSPGQLSNSVDMLTNSTNCITSDTDNSSNYLHVYNFVFVLVLALISTVIS